MTSAKKKKKFKQGKLTNLIREAGMTTPNPKPRTESALQFKPRTELRYSAFSIHCGVVVMLAN